MIEQWKDVIGYEEHYQISSLGNVYSKRQNKMIRSQTLPNKQYNRVHLYKNGVYWKVQVHRLVYVHFVGEIPNGLEIDHIDEDPKNNSMSNLRCVTKVQNQFNRTKTKKARPMRTYTNGHSYCYSTTINHTLYKKCGFNTPEQAFFECESIRNDVKKQLWCNVDNHKNTN